MKTELTKDEKEFLRLILLRAKQHLTEKNCKKIDTIYNKIIS